MTKRQKDPWEIKATWSEKPVLVGDGYAISPRLTVEATRTRDGQRFEYEVQIDTDRAKPRAKVTRLTVLSDAPWGVSSTTLRDVPIRDLAATALRDQMLRVKITDTGATREPVKDNDAGVIAVVKRLVGYNEGKGLK